MSDLLSGHLPPVTVADMIAEVEREIAMREKVYPRWIDAGRLKATNAAEHMRRMRAVLDLLKREQVRRAAE